MENNPMGEKPTYRELEHRIKELEKEVFAHKQTEKAIQESEVRFREIFKNSKNSIVVYDAVNDGEDFNIVDCNPACERIELIKREDLIGKSVLQVFPGVKDFGLFDVLQRVCKTGKPEKHPVAMYKDERISGWRDNFVYRLPTGEIVVIYTDETDRIEAEKALRESYERIETVLFSLPTGIMIIDSETNEIIEANPQALSMIGSPLELIVGSKYHQFICAAEMRNPISDLEISCNSSESILIGADGAKVPTHKTIIPVTFDGRECFIVNFVDITEHKQAESERIQKEKLQGVVEMAGAVCHEMSQPLQAVAGLSELLTMEVKEGDPLFNNIIKIQEQTIRMSEITKKLMKVTKYETKGYLKGKIIDIDKATLLT
jgi:PAS domain S-box-containing protein